MCIVLYQRHGTFRPVNVLQVQWHTRGDAADAEEYFRVFWNILDYCIMFA